LFLRYYLFFHEVLSLSSYNISNKNASQSQNPQQQSQSGSSNVQAGGDITIYNNNQLSQREINGDFPLRENSFINLDKPIEDQL